MTRKLLVVLLTGLTSLLLLSGCGKGADAAVDKVIIYTNADDEPVAVMKEVLDKNGYQGKYKLQSFGTAELGGKLLAEGENIEADLVTMSTFYLQSAQQKNQMFKDLQLPLTPINQALSYTAPLTMQEGAIFYNSQIVKEENISLPTSLQDLADPKYAGLLSISDIKQSSTAWLLFQALIAEYGEKKAQEIIQGIYQNAGDHLESSGSGPIKKVRLGEVAIGFGLRHQAVQDQAAGLPIGVIEPSEGTYALTESLAVIDKGEATNSEAEKMLELLLTKSRPKLLPIYPSLLYDGETVDPTKAATELKSFPQELTAELLQEHQALVE